MRILVTGGAGFVGSHLVDRLLDDGHEVVVLDSLISGREENLSAAADRPGLRVIRADVCEPYDLEVDRIYNLASPASPRHYQRDPVHTARTNLLGMMHALDLAARTGARVLQASTSEVYGDPLVHPQSETYWGNVNPIGPRACYDETKRAAESLLVDYARTRGVQGRIARIFNTYGPRMSPDDGRVVSNFVVQALSGEPITIYGDGRQTRSFCFVSDLVDGLVRLMESDIGDPVNLGNPAEISMGELATMILDRTGSAAPVVHVDLPVDDPQRRRPDIGRARDRLGWTPHVGIEEGLDRTIAHFRAVLSGTKV